MSASDEAARDVSTELAEATAAVEALPNGIRHPKKRAFLSAYCTTGNISEAARLAGMNRLAHYHWLSTDERYAEVFEQAVEIAGDYLEAVARDRATKGWLEPVYYKGEMVGHIRKYSDTLLIFLLKGARPEKFRDNATIRHTGPGGGAIQVQGDYELSERMMANPDVLAAADIIAAALLEDRTAGELGPVSEPIVVNSEELNDDEEQQ